MLGFVQKYEWLTACSGIELNILPDNSYHSKVCSVSIDKNQLHIDAKQEIKGSLPAVFKKLSKQPVALSLTGKGVLIKQVSKLDAISEGALRSLFPGLQLQDFYIQNFISGGSSFVALARKEMIDALIREFAEKGIKILSITFGPFAVSHIFNQLNLYENQLVFDGHSIVYDKAQNWEEYNYILGVTSKFQLKIGIEAIADKYLIAYATAFQLALYPRLDTIVANISVIEKVVTDYQEEKKFKLRATLVLLAFFIALLINFFVFSYYEEKNKDLLLAIHQSSSDIEMIRVKEAEIKEKEKLIHDLGWNKGVSYAWICDQIGQTIPSTIHLTELIINPVNTVEGNTTRKDVFDIGKLKITGTSPDLKAVNDWIYRLKDKSWIKQVNLEGYERDETDSMQHFTIIMQY